jgi:hypothetical protein
MPADPATLTLAEAAHRAAEVADPHNEDPEVGTFMAYLEDADEPISAVAHVSARVEEARRGADPEGDVPAVTMAAAVTTYLAFRREEVEEPREHLLRLSARAEFDDGEPPEQVAAWLAAQGVKV